MRRKLFNFAAAVSLVLCVVTAAWWVRSYWVSETIGRVGESEVIVVVSGGGALVLSVTKADPENEEPWPRPYYAWHRSAAGGSPGGLVVELRKTALVMLARPPPRGQSGGR